MYGYKKKNQKGIAVDISSISDTSIRNRIIDRALSTKIRIDLNSIKDEPDLHLAVLTSNLGEMANLQELSVFINKFVDNNQSKEINDSVNGSIIDLVKTLKNKIKKTVF